MRFNIKIMRFDRQDGTEDTPNPFTNIYAIVRSVGQSLCNGQETDDLLSLTHLYRGITITININSTGISVILPKISHLLNLYNLSLTNDSF